MSRSLRAFTAFIACWLGPHSALPAQGDATESGRPFLDVFTPGDYRGHQQVFDVAQSSAGLIYLSNFGALMEFDGAKWRKIAVPTQFIRSLAADEAGRIWLGGVDELGWCEPGPDGAGAHLPVVGSSEFADRASMGAATKAVFVAAPIKARNRPSTRRCAHGAAVFHSLLARLPAECLPPGPVYTVEWHGSSAWFSTDRHVLRWRDGRFQHWSFPRRQLAPAAPRREAALAQLPGRRAPPLEWRRMADHFTSTRD